VKFVSYQPLLPWQRKFENFNRKLPITELLFSMGDMFLIPGTQQVDACIADFDQMLRDSEIVIVGNL